MVHAGWTSPLPTGCLFCPTYKLIQRSRNTASSSHKGLWQPEWVPAVFVVYSQAQPHPAGHSCAIVFCDEDRPYRHIIEFTPLPNDLLATLNSERDGDSQPAAAPRSAEPLNRVQAEH